jgi:hypothetical protein
MLGSFLIRRILTWRTSSNRSSSYTPVNTNDSV